MSGPGAGKKARLDALLVARGLARDVPQAERLIGAGRVLVDSHMCDKAGTLVHTGSLVSVKPGKRFVSRGGDKLEAALQRLALDPKGCVCVDIGSSTGGFTDCLLRYGATRVYSVDVGYGLLDWKLRRDERVVVLERTNARHLSREHIPEAIDLAVIDASFISLQPLLSPLLRLFRASVRILALVKPQFQLPRDKIMPGGVVSDDAHHRLALAMVRDFALDLGLQSAGTVASPVRGMKGNQEFFMLLSGFFPVERIRTEIEKQGGHDVSEVF
ncbi:TlyA family RNA methyltransferase [Desulfobulbus alkaliphilus]|uniref:TlyA family RNA methyltransferase n=1 Tax=Desulfobulbus alkaliphilus TaxID=869814 RepID=UPI001962B724|nr:TlyA family RNA methyltransferase [Desulfobulbus alkaliphilus]MBM9535728.1 TlyA family RNA methyltransferase [Desulfobulbus alkaliphilus]